MISGVTPVPTLSTRLEANKKKTDEGIYSPWLTRNCHVRLLRMLSTLLAQLPSILATFALPKKFSGQHIFFHNFPFFFCQLLAIWSTCMHFPIRCPSDFWRVTVAHSAMAMPDGRPRPGMPLHVGCLPHGHAARPLNAHRTIEKLTVFIYDEQWAAHTHPQTAQTDPPLTPLEVDVCVTSMQNTINRENFLIGAEIANGIDVTAANRQIEVVLQELE